MNNCFIATNFCDWIDSYQKALWYRIGYSHSIKGIKVYETAITQNLVFDLLLKEFKNVTIYEAVNERVNGADLIVELTCGNLKEIFAVQAKVVKKNGKFPTTNHEVGKSKKQQIDLLLDYAKRNKFKAYYMFYCYDQIKDHPDYGICMSEANIIKTKYFKSNGITIPKMSDFYNKPHFYSADQILCCNSKILNNIPNKSINTNINMNYWREIGSQFEMNIKSDAKDVKSEDFEGFNPAYLIRVDYSKTINCG